MPAPLSYSRRILEIVNTMSKLGWNRRRAIRFAIAKVARNPQAPAPTRKRPPRTERSEYALEMLTHRNRTMHATRGL